MVAGPGVYRAEPSCVGPFWNVPLFPSFPIVVGSDPLEDRMEGLKVGNIYRLRFPGIAARVIEPPASTKKSRYPYLVESIILRSRWWVNERGEPDNIHSPQLVVPRSHEDADRQVSGGIAASTGSLADSALPLPRPAGSRWRAVPGEGKNKQHL